jgi:hypothetical protein
MNQEPKRKSSSSPRRALAASADGRAKTRARKGRARAPSRRAALETTSLRGTRAAAHTARPHRLLRPATSAVPVRLHCWERRRANIGRRREVVVGEEKRDWGGKESRGLGNFFTTGWSRVFTNPTLTGKRGDKGDVNERARCLCSPSPHTLGPIRHGPNKTSKRWKESYSIELL